MPTVTDDRARFFLAGVILITFGIYLFEIIFGGTHADATLVGAGLGYLAANATAVVNYFYGSSSGSRAKDSLLTQNNVVAKGE